MKLKIVLIPLIYIFLIISCGKNPTSRQEVSTIEIIDSIFTAKELYFYLKGLSNDRTKYIQSKMISYEMRFGDNRDVQKYDILKDQNYNKLLDIYNKKSKKLLLGIRDTSGFDYRKEYYEETNRDIQNNCNKVCCIVSQNKLSPKNLRPTDNGFYTFTQGNTLGNELVNPCPNQKYLNEPTYGIGTGFAISSKLIITAYHNFNNGIDIYMPIDKARFVFGYRLHGGNDFQFKFKYEDIYSGKYYKQEPKDVNHWAIIQLDRDRQLQPGLFFSQDQIENDFSNIKEIYMIGFPKGLPLKITPVGNYDRTVGPYTMECALDSYVGNSGGPVFNFATNKIIGILLSGPVGYVSFPCAQPKVLHFDQDPLENVIRIDAIISDINGKN